MKTLDSIVHCHSFFSKNGQILCRHRPTSGQYRSMTTQNVYMYVRTCAIVIENQSWSIKGILAVERNFFLLLILPKKMFNNNCRECSETNILFRVIICSPHIFRPIAGKCEFTQAYSEPQGIGNFHPRRMGQIALYL